MADHAPLARLGRVQGAAGGPPIGSGALRGGRYAQATSHFRRALELGERERGRNSLSVAHLINNLAVTYEAQGRFGEAESLFRRAIAIHETALGPHHPGLAAPLNNLAELYRAQGRQEEAEPLARRALALR